MSNLATTYTRSTIGIQALSIQVEAHISNGLPIFNIVGLPETAIKESRDRVRSAILNANFEFPYRRITVNLAPANIPKSGSGFDLAIAIAILIASEQVNPQTLEPTEYLGELALSGEIRPVQSVIPSILGAKQDNRVLIISKENEIEAAHTA